MDVLVGEGLLLGALLGFLYIIGVTTYNTVGPGQRAPDRFDVIVYIFCYFVGIVLRLWWN